MPGMRHLLNALSFATLFLLVCVCHQAHAAPAGLELPDYLKPLPRYLFVGELHGTAETPVFFLQLVREYLKDNPRLVVALELDPVEQEALDRFMTDGKASTEVAEKRLLKERGWRGYMGHFDGRTSQAMLQLLHELRGIALQQHNGYPKVVAFLTGTDEHAARIIQRAMMRSLGANLVSLSGNVHAMKKPPSMRPDQKTMPMFFPAEKTFSLDVLPRGGRAWACTGKNCGELALQPATNAPDCAEDCYTRLPPDGDFDARYVLMRATASPPAARK
jgi:hypothetical protein